MAQITVTINGRSYEVACDDGQEEHVTRLGRYVEKKVAELAGQVGQVGDTRLLVMAALMLTDELSEAYGELKNIREGTAGVGGQGESANDATEAADPATVETIRALARRIEGIAEGLERA
jgi:cell division protein ZapA